MLKDRRIELNEAAIDARFSLARQENSLRGFMITRDEYFAGRVKEHLQSFETALEKVMAMSGPDSAFASQFEEVERAMAAWHSEIADPVIANARQDSTYPRALAIFNSGKADQFIEPIEGTIDALRDRERAAMDVSQASAAEAIAFANTVIVTGLLFLAGSAIVLGFMLAKGIVRPLDQMTQVMRRLAGGDKSVDVPAQDRGDEIGSMAAAVQTFKAQAIEQERLEKEAQASRISQEEAKQRQAALDNAKAEDLRVFVGMVEAGFDRLSSGDLTVRMSGRIAPEFEPIRAKFNASVEALEGAIGHVVGTIGAIRTGLSEINV
ncbi:CHASE3 domain-containing protein, partial [Jiella marina]|uniref:CHASE3 domain-containing protein n=1 Tax=Jiella sp. LLJ827 TaxID=2917712 RepID=UPI00350E53B6